MSLIGKDQRRAHLQALEQQLQQHSGLAHCDSTLGKEQWECTGGEW
jgi:hypothetical protein